MFCTTSMVQQTILSRFIRVVFLKPMHPRWRYSVSSIPTKADGYLILAFLRFIASKSSLMQGYLFPFQRSALVDLSSKVKKRHINLNRFSDIVDAKTSWELSWFQMACLLWRFYLKPHLKWSMPINDPMSIWSTTLTWGYLSNFLRRSENLSSTDWIQLSVCWTIFLIIASVEKSLNEANGDFTDLAGPVGPGLFL